MSDHRHGDYDPHLGWYSEIYKGWMRDPKKIGTLPKPIEVNDQMRRDYEAMQAKAKGTHFTPDKNLEQLIKLRESDKQEKRETFERLATGRRRMELHDYEAKRQARLDRGGEVA
jgi:CRISPR/Cas system CSM-associated protein Csm4 (group 5 of RAMP superfamily)